MRTRVQPSSVKPDSSTLTKPVWQDCETTSLQALVDILRKPSEAKCPHCRGSGKGAFKGFCEHCLGRGTLIAP